MPLEIRCFHVIKTKHAKKSHNYKMVVHVEISKRMAFFWQMNYYIRVVRRKTQKKTNQHSVNEAMCNLNGSEITDMKFERSEQYTETECSMRFYL